MEQFGLIDTKLEPVDYVIFQKYFVAQKTTAPPASLVEGATAAPTDEELKVQRLLQESSATAAGNTESTDADREGCDTTDVFQVITP